jgi:hypothetical protein
MRRDTDVRRAALFIVLVLVGAAVYEAGIALERIPLGTQPGEGARYEGLVMAAAAIAMLAGVAVSLMLAARGRRSIPAAFFAVAAAALMVAHYYTFDTYYLPTLTRYSDSGSFSSAWVFSLAIVCALTSLLAFARPLFGFMASAVVIPLCLFTTVFAGFGH